MRRCTACGFEMHGGQYGMHLECCAAQGGRRPVCNPVRVDKNTDTARDVCARCWIDADEASP